MNITKKERDRISYGGWQQHDVLILHNPRIAHGRLPFIGQRQIGVLMTHPMRLVAGDDRWRVTELAG